MDILPEQLREQCPVFRVLIIGRRNAGKTTILKKMAGIETTEEPQIRDTNGVLVEGNVDILISGLARGMSMIDYEITFPSNPSFVFHDSRGVESGPDSDLGESTVHRIWSFIENRRERPKLKDQVHAIWFCMPMDNVRVPSNSFELAFFEKGNGGVPVIAVLTKYEAFVKRVKDKLGREPRKRELMIYAERDIMNPMRTTVHPPAGYVQTHHHGDGCALLSEKTHREIKDDTLATIFAMAQQASKKMLCGMVFLKALNNKAIGRFTQILESKGSSEGLAKQLTMNALSMMPFWRWVSSCINNRMITNCLHLCRACHPANIALDVSVFIACKYVQAMQPLSHPANLALDVSVFLGFICVLGCWTSKESREPWNHMDDAIQWINSTQGFADHIRQSVKQCFRDFGRDHRRLSSALAELVVKYVNDV
ncbi:hypothetical protein BT96DRAFT_886272 [Gymnopus androsaceus JB14]|uniref:G domain-containing protein n=1 Tax=Gymnopus androsaceus JB14 TaxID=1447944 RepID=A0A6A4H9P4_9AGAR|nr:hypothetical protein BT96DRAFT_886272 [Gymnopus androsaceus JB14]